jgi:hypothetical protein
MTSDKLNRNDKNQINPFLTSTRLADKLKLGYKYCQKILVWRIGARKFEKS